MDPAQGNDQNYEQTSGGSVSYGGNLEVPGLNTEGGSPVAGAQQTSDYNNQFGQNYAQQTPGYNGQFGQDYTGGVVVNAVKSPVETIPIEEAFQAPIGGAVTNPVIMPNHSGKLGLDKEGASQSEMPLRAAAPVPGSIGSAISVPVGGEAVEGAQAKKDSSKRVLMILSAVAAVVAAILAVVLVMRMI